MATVESSVAAATAVVEYDLFVNVAEAEIRAGQRITGVALKGSAAAGDTRVRFQTSQGVVATVYNNNTGFPGRDDILPVSYIHAGSPSHIYATVVDAPATNPINAVVVIQ